MTSTNSSGQPQRPVTISGTIVPENTSKATRHHDIPVTRSGSDIGPEWDNLRAALEHLESALQAQIFGKEDVELPQAARVLR